MKQPDKLWYDICYRYSQQSKCKSRQVGCVLVYEDRCIGQGFNGAPEGSDCDQCRRARCTNKVLPSGTDLDDAICAHSEANLIGYCARHGVRTNGASLFCTTYPCHYCAGLIVAAGIKEVVYDTIYGNPEYVAQIFAKAKIVVRRFNI